jgi:hypothetical protein
MSRAEEGGDLPIRRIPNGEFHIDGELVLASKERLLMYFRNCLPFLRLLQGLKVIFLSPLPRFMYTGCCRDEEHGVNRGDEDFEEVMRAGLQEVRNFFKDFLFTNGLRGFRVRNPGFVVPWTDEDGLPLWGTDPVHPSYEAYNRIADLIEEEAASMTRGVQKRRGEQLAPPSKKPRFEHPRPSWIGDGYGGGYSRPGGSGGYGGYRRGGGHRGGGGEQSSGAGRGGEGFGVGHSGHRGYKRGSGGARGPRSNGGGGGSGGRWSRSGCRRGGY